MSLLKELIKKISFFVFEKSASKIVDTIIKNNFKEDDTDDPLKKLLIEEARILSAINYEVEKTSREIENIKNLIYALSASNIIIIILLVIIIIKK